MWPADEDRIVDNLPGATTFVTIDRTRKYYAAGFKLGIFQDEVRKGYIFMGYD